MLRGEKIYLRELGVGDVTQKYVDWLNDPDVNQYLETRFVTQSAAAVEQFVQDKEKDPDEFLFGIFRLSDSHHIGNIKLGPVNRHHLFAPISLFIGDKSCWGQNLATEAIGLIVAFGFKECGLEKVEAGCYEINIGSQRAFEKNGFVVEGCLRKQRAVAGGRTSDILLGLLKEEWLGE